MQPNNLTALDFDDIRSSIKSYLRTRDEFTDYDFDGSSLSYLIDLLAYNTYYTAFNANMALNESFLSSATVRDNVVNIAKLLNYVPRSIRAAKAIISFKLQTTQSEGSYPPSVTLKKGPVATGCNYIWNTLTDVTVNVNPISGEADFCNIPIYEGSIVKFSYVVNTFAKQIYKVPSEDVDTSTLVVMVKPNESSTQFDIYTRAATVSTVTPTTRAYFLSESEDMRYEIRFGDDSVGRSVKDGEVIELEYLVTAGKAANECGRFGFIGKLQDSNGSSFASATISIVTRAKSLEGDAAETIESIKYTAPRYYSTQYRAVTAQDYAILTKTLYANADAVVAYGGDSLNPPVYGKVYVVIKTKTGSLLNDATKKEISGLLRPYAMASIDPIIIDPDDIYIVPKIFALYDTGCGSNPSEIQSDVSAAIVDWGTQTEINNFNSTFRSQSLEKAIILSNKCITDVSLQVTILRYIEPSLTDESNTYCISTGSPLYNSGPSLDISTGGQCTKEPVVVSGTFRTADRPGVDQQFEDDGFGNLLMFYNTGTRKIYTDTNAGTVNYETGEVCFGPVNVIWTGDGGGLPPEAVIITNPDTGIGNVIDFPLIQDTAGGGGTSPGGGGGGSGPGLGNGGVKIPIIFIPANNSTIPASSPGTIINIVSPPITISPVGTPTPATVPLNSLTPTDYNVKPPVLDIPNISNQGSINDTSCF
jgi:hypothetical protein